ncbi:glycosyltransferase [Robbsia sp. KACC 23696]|uniref:glycosyltransferase n=1 Tax=Robbsia sp. KACC 23696 TaxID=3149231 RepID=UPI00325B633A
MLNVLLPRMQILFIHQNIPGQFRHLILAISKDPAHEVWALGEARRVAANWRQTIPNLKLFGYVFNEVASTIPNGSLKTTDTNIRRGLAVAKSLSSLAKQGLAPDVIYGHPGWGEMLFVRDVFPNAKIVNFCEFYFNFEGQDCGFDPEFRDPNVTPFDVRAQNMTQTQSMLSADLGIAPTLWQKSRYPAVLQKQIEVVFDGIDCDVVKPNPVASLSLPNGKVLAPTDEVVTFVNRNLEPYRGFHVFMRSLPILLKERPNAQVVIVGDDGVSYGRPLKGTTYREYYTKQVGDSVDWSRVHFLGRVSYARYLCVLQVSTVHVYLTYPFVLSWSLMESMAAGCAVLASSTAPVLEVIDDGVNGMLVDFFNAEALAAGVVKALENRIDLIPMRTRAFHIARKQYDLNSVCLPRLFKYLGLVN